MIAKIEWYEEVLALDPGSKLFVPFARCLVEQGMRDRAIEVLRAGLAVHPEYMEARVLLIHLLDESGDVEASCAESRRVADVLMGYPGFWKALGDAVSQTRGSDVALCLRFVAVALRNPSVTLAGMVARGLGLVGEDGGTSEAEGVMISEQVSGQTVLDGSQTSAEELRQETDDNLKGQTVERSEFEAQPPVPPAEPSVSHDEEPTHCVSERIETEEPVSLRTRSMAQILAEQGDLDGALIIYEELAVQDPDSAELRRRISELRRQKTDGSDRSRYGSLDAAVVTMASETTPKESVTSDAGGAKQVSKDIVALLEGLADRLDARAGA